VQRSKWYRTNDLGDEPVILVTAANGNQGKLLIPRLLGSGASVRACVNTEDSAERLRMAGVGEVMVGDLSDGVLIRRVMEEIDTVYYVGPALHPHERAMGLAAVAAAQSAGVGHFVFSSVLHAVAGDLIQHAIKRDIEERLIGSGLAYTILQPANYMLAHRLRSVFEEHVFRLSWSLERRQSLVYPGDLAEVAHQILSDGERHVGATYELAAPGHFSAHDLARICSEQLGAPVGVERLSSDDFLRSLVGDPDTIPYQAGVSRAISAYYSSHDFIGNANVLTWLLGRRPTTFAQFVTRELEVWNRARASTGAPGR
jgi:uncharacterized protein YbjT (DUF2867 family)